MYRGRPPQSALAAVALSLAALLVAGVLPAPRPVAAAKLEAIGQALSGEAAPTATAPTVSFTPYGMIRRGKVQLTVSWPPATPSGAAIVRYALHRQADGGSWRRVRLPSALTQSVQLRAKPWSVHQFRVRARDEAGNWSAWAIADPLWLGATQESDESVVLSDGWAIVPDQYAHGGQRATTTSPLETATFNFVGSQVAWVARIGPDGGTASVSIDGESPTAVNLFASSGSSRRVVFQRSWAAAGPHTLEVAVTSEGARVDVDSFLVIGDPARATLVGAGDIASCSYTRDTDTALVVSGVLAADPSAVVYTTGDNVYPDGTAENYSSCYDPSWGAFKSSTRPTPGNHDYYNNPGAGPYFAYFGANAGEPGKGFYAYEAGTWRVYALNSECAKSSACYVEQYEWLRADLASRPHRCTIAMWHRPVFSTGSHGGSTRMQEVFELLYNSGTDVVLAGHDHGYQRFAPADPTGTPDGTRGIRHFVIATGGASLYAFKTDSTLLEVRDNTSYGVLRFDLTPGSYSWEFLPRAGDSFTDTGQSACH